MYIQVHIISVCTVYLAECFAQKRDFQQKRIEIQIEYLKKNLDLLTDLENYMFILSRRVDSCLSKSIDKDRQQEYNSIIGDMSRTKSLTNILSNPIQKKQDNNSI